MRRRRVVRLDSLVLGARPDRLAAQREIPAASVSPLTDEEQTRLHVLNYHRQGRILTAAELLERQRLLRRAIVMRGSSRA